MVQPLGHAIRGNFPHFLCIVIQDFPRLSRPPPAGQAANDRKPENNNKSNNAIAKCQLRGAGGSWDGGAAATAGRGAVQLEMKIV